MSLPIAAFRAAIIASIAAHAVTIIVAETGAGKSTQVPQYLLDAGKRVVVTQPRRLAAMTVAERVAEERGGQIGHEVGYRLGGGVHVDSSATRCLFVTEGLALVRELMSRGGDVGYDVLVLDEVHEWHQDMEILVAWAKRQLAAGARFRLVLMSATMEAEKLSAYFGGAPVISVPGRVFPVVTRTPDALRHEDRDVWGPIARDVEALVLEGRNVLVFAPGKPEISALCERLAKLDAVVLPLHGQLDKADQKRCFRHYDCPKVVVATNVAQTSITIDDIDAVVDSGLERRIEVSGGVEGLRLRLISRADSEQRKGRAGRCREGIYIDHAETARQTAPGVGSRDDWPTPEIQRVLLDQAVLRLAMAGLDLEELDLFHAIAPSEVHGAKEVLRVLGCLGNGITVTEIGARVSRLPTGVRTGRMLVEAESRGVVSEVATIAAIVESGGIVDGKAVDEKTRVPLWRSHITDPQSDHITFLRMFDRAASSRGQWRAMGLHGKGMSQAVDARKAIGDAASRVLAAPKKRGGRDDIAKCVIAGLVDQLRQRRTNRWGEYVYEGRKLGSECAIKADAVEWCVGTPFDISTKKGGTMGLLKFCTAVDLAWLGEIAPQMITRDPRRPEYDPEKDVVSREVVVSFRGQAIREEREACSVGDADGAAALVSWLTDALMSSYCDRAKQIASEPHRQAILALREQRTLAADLNGRLGEDRYPIGSQTAIREFLAAAIDGAVRLADVPVERLSTSLVSADEAARIRALHPDEIQIGDRTMRVAYGDGHPRVQTTSDAWRDLPDELRTPGGRLIEVRVGSGWSHESATDLRALKERLAAAERGRAFSDWRDRPDVASSSIDEVQYGTDGDGTPRIAYGVIDGYHRSVWFASREEAQAALDEAVANRAAQRLDTARYALPYGHPMRDRDQRDLDVAGMLALASEMEAEVEAIKVREEQERTDAAQVHAALEGRNSIDDQTALAVLRFVRDCIDAYGGDAHRVADRLEDEQYAAYGRVRRSDAISAAFPGVDHRGLDWKADADIVPCAAYARAVAGERRPAKQHNPQAKPRAHGSAGFGTLGDALRAKGFGK